ncbi:AIR synthase related protein [Herbiconiux sp. CPCC 203407]|uniref:Thiamine-monophosphate kinase n=1 Tax=Herbiconiux oxytropis TaxID=2970915 RepID=A0AA42BT26_9MICO|nr:AIR synthase related protein [Herbiconiux oxytropis]MCS5723872.1 AIR synthase related protein [Herbiconiux oxytropis]MCS5725930.1 AIR synthase related protein [Herbiconiux oxytropis]
MAPDSGLPANAETLASVGEGEVLRRIFPRLPHADAELLGPGDDAAVVAAPDGRYAVTTDMMIHGPDFRLAWSTPHDLGWKAAMSNLADVAAMGARPTALVVAIAAPLETPVEVLLGIADGLRDACALAAPGCGVVGGDLSVSATLTLAVTAFGDLGGRAPVTRSGARPGDVVAVAGPLGLAGAGIWLLFRDGVAPAPRSAPLPRYGALLEAADSELGAGSGSTPPARGLDSVALPTAREPDAAAGRAVRAAHPDLVEAQLAPRAPIGLGTAAAEAGATAMLDVSDGLVLDARRLAVASGCAVSFDPAAIAREARALLDTDAVVGDRAADFVLAGGEDHALLATFPADALLPPGFRALGTVVEAAGAPGGRPDALIGDRPHSALGGWDPYADWDGHAG